MEKTRLGVTVGMLSAAIFFTGLFSGFLVAIVLAGYVLLYEQNAWLKKNAVKAVALMILFSLLTTVVNLIPNAMGFINDFVSIFNGSFYVAILNKLVTVVVSGVNIIEKVVFILLGIAAMNQKNIPIPIVDGLVNKCID